MNFPHNFLERFSRSKFIQRMRDSSLMVNAREDSLLYFSKPNIEQEPEF